MSFFFKFLTGAVIGGSATLYYRSEIESTSSKLSRDLNSLSLQLVKGRELPLEPVKTSNGSQLMIPKRLPLTEEIKSRWNEQLYNGFESIRTTDYSRIATSSYQGLKNLLGKAKHQVEQVDPTLTRSSSNGNGNEGIVEKNERMVDRIDGKL